jgi:AraC-like DNA-binding protein
VVLWNFCEEPDVVAATNSAKHQFEFSVVRELRGMKKSDYTYQPHLSLKEFSIPPSGQWVPQSTCWSLIQVRQGIGYYLQPELNQELQSGTALLVAGSVRGSLRASQLGGLSLYSFSVVPARLTGLITFSEQNFLEKEAGKKFSLQIFPPDSPIAVKMRKLYANRNGSGLLFRLNLLQLFFEIFTDELEKKQTVSNVKNSDSGKSLQIFLEETPSSELLEMNFGKLAQLTNCSSRHLSRIFHKYAGMSFRDKRTEIRLTRACELLATSNFKVVEVALESGYKSLSLFNLMFARRFGMSPSKWRQKYGSPKVGQNKRIKSLATPKNYMLAFKVNLNSSRR